MMSLKVIYLGSHSGNINTEALQRISTVSEVKIIAGSDEKLWILLKDGSLHNVLIHGEKEFEKLSSDVADAFACGSQFFTLHKDEKINEWPIKAGSQREEENIPVPLALPSKKKVVQVACGKSHMLLLTKYGEVYTRGDNAHGQLGLGKIDSANVSKLEVVKALKGLPIWQITAGHWSSFCVTISGRVYAWGRNEYGELGLESVKAKTIIAPKIMAFSTNNAVTFVSAGEDHTAILTKNGELFTCGRNSYGQLGHSDTSTNQSSPWRVQELNKSVVTLVSCGHNHTVAYVPECGKLFGFGDNHKGQLGIFHGSGTAMLSGPWCDDQNVKVKEIFAVANYTFVLSSSSGGEQQLEMGNEVIPEHRYIARIDDAQCDRTARLDVDSDEYEQELEELKLLFSSQSCLNASFCVAEKRPMSKEFLGIDFVLAGKMMARLCKHDDAEICEVIVEGLSKGLVSNLSHHCADIEALKVYLILPIVIDSILKRCNGDDEFVQKLIPHRCLDDVFISFLEKALGSHISALKSMLKVVGNDYFEMLLHLCKVSIIAVLFPALEPITEHSRLQSSLEVLNILFDINKEIHIVNYKEFYIPDLPVVLLHQHFTGWKNQTKQWNFCDFPFLLSANSKTELLLIDSKVRHGNVFNRFILYVDRNNLLGSDSALKEVSDIQRPVLIKFIGEEGFDDGALKKEYFMLIFEEILNNNSSYKLCFEENKTSHLLWFSKNKCETLLDKYIFIGKLIGMALYNGIIVNFPLPLALYKNLLGEKPTLEDFVEIDPSFGNSLRQILNFEEDDGITVEEAFDLNFTVPGMDEIPLVDGGENIPVTAQNRRQYVDRYLKYFFHKSVQSKLDAFRSGFFQACDKGMLTLFRPEELMEMVTGYEDYDWKVLENATSYRPINCPSGGFDRLHPVIKWFWEILHSMSKEEKNKFLIFLTGSNKIPIVGLHMTIKQRQECDDFLPTAEVCYNALHLHSYSSKKILEERLRRSMQCKGFHMV